VNEKHWAEFRIHLDQRLAVIDHAMCMAVVEAGAIPHGSRQTVVRPRELRGPLSRRPMAGAIQT